MPGGWIMFKKVVFYVCMFFVVSVLIAGSAYALGLGFNPSAQTVVQGDYATVDIETDDFLSLAGYDILLEYDPFILDIETDDIDFYPIWDDKDVLRSEIEVDPNSGTIYLSLVYEIYSDDTPPDRVIPFPLASLRFYASNVGTSELKFSSIALYDTEFLEYAFSLSDFEPTLSADEDDPIFPSITTNGEISVTNCPLTESPSATPEPSTLILLGISSLIGLGYSKRKKF